MKPSSSLYLFDIRLSVSFPHFMTSSQSKNQVWEFKVKHLKYIFSFTVNINEERIRNIRQYLGKSADSILTPSDTIDYLIANQNRINRIDHHLRPQYLQCDFCNTHIDFLAKVETRNQDFEHIVRILGLKGNMKIDVQKNAQNASSECEFFAHIKPQRIEELNDKVYKTDYELFGYDKTILKCD